MKLHDFQAAAIKKMHNGCILCGETGSGKSLTGLAYYHLLCGGTLDPMSKMIAPLDIYIITTAKKRDNREWEGELGNFLLSSIPEDNEYTNKVTVDSWNNIKKYKDVTNAFFIFDEQRVVGYGAWSKTFITIARSNKWILLSATPGDTWSDYAPVFIANGYYKNITEFRRVHCQYSRSAKYPKIERYWETGRLNRLRNRVLVDMDFRKGTIPHHENVNVNYDIQEYKSLQKNRWNEDKQQPIESASELCYALRKIVNSNQSRIEAVLHLIELKKKAIIFYSFDYELFALREAFAGTDVKLSEWNGHRHDDVPTGEKWVYLVQYNAGAEGWNCIATDTIIFYSQNYSYKMMVQAAGRIDRLNTPYVDLYFYHLKSKAPIDLAISMALNKKQNFNENRFYRGGY